MAAARAGSVCNRARWFKRDSVRARRKRTHRFCWGDLTGGRTRESSVIVQRASVVGNLHDWNGGLVRRTAADADEGLEGALAIGALSPEPPTCNAPRLLGAHFAEAE